MVDLNADRATAPVRARLLDAEPQLFVTDVTAACAYYEGHLAFGVVFKYGAPPYYAQVARDGVRLNLRCVAQPTIDPRLRDREQLLAATITLATRADVERLASEYGVAGVAFFQDIRVEPWGAINFIVRDLDGNLLLFAGPAD